MSTAAQPAPGFDFNWEAGESRIVSIEGGEYSGKTDLALNVAHMMKEKGLHVAYQTLDYGENRALPRYEDLQVNGKQVIGKVAYEYEWDPNLKERNELEKQGEHIRNTVWKRFERDYRHACSSGKFGAVIWDTATEVWEVHRLAHFGKLSQVPEMMYPVINAEYKELIRYAKKHGVYLILIHQVKDEYVEKTGDNGKVKREKSGKQLRAGNGKINYLVDVAVRMKQVVKRGQPLMFEAEVLKAGANKDLVGQTLTMPDFATLMTLVQPVSADTAEVGDLEI